MSFLETTKDITIYESLSGKLSGCVLKHDAISLTGSELVITFKECCAQLKSKSNGLYVFEFTITSVDNVQMLVSWNGNVNSSHAIVQSYNRVFFITAADCRFIDVNVFP